MLASQIGAYNNSANYNFQQANSGFELARVAALQEKPEFPKSANGINTRAAIVPTDGTDRSNNRRADNKTEGRGRFVDVFA